MDRVHSPADDLPHGEGGVVARADFAAGGLDGGDGGGGGARGDDVEGLVGGQGFLAGGEELDAVLGRRDAAGLMQFPDGDGARGVDAALGDPGGQLRQVDGLQVHGEGVDETALSGYDLVGGLAAVEGPA